MQKDMDLRYVGNILGLPMYIDVSSVPNTMRANHLSERDAKVALVRIMMQKNFYPPKKEDQDATL